MNNFLKKNKDISFLALDNVWKPYRLFYFPVFQAEIQEAKLDSSNVCMASLEREMRFLVKEVDGLRETAERVKGLERDNRELTKQAAIDQRTLATLREVRTDWMHNMTDSV